MAHKLNVANPEHLVYTTDVLIFSILGGIRISGLDRLRTTIKISGLIDGNFPLRYNLDFYNSDQTEKLIRRTAEHFELELKDVRSALMGLMEGLESYRLQRLEEAVKPKVTVKPLTEEETAKAILYLKAKNLMDKTMDDIGKSGVIGEDLNRLLMYLVYTSRKLSNPLHIISLGASGTGKTHLQEKVAELIPEEDRIEITSLTKNSLYYFQKDELFHKLILIEDLDGTTDESMYAIRELQSKKRLSKTIAQKDQSGMIKTETITVDAIVSIAGTTTRESIYEDNSNRSFLIHIDGSKEQDERIMDYQRKKSAGEINIIQEGEIRELFKAVQRTLNPVRVINPYAKHLRLPEGIYKPRRTMNLYLSFIEAITFYHQFQRKILTTSSKEKFIHTTIEDIKWANMLLSEVFLQKSDDISKPSRECLEKIKVYLLNRKKECFYARELKSELRINSNNLKRYLKELESNGYVRIIGGGRYSGYEYKVLSSVEYQDMKTGIHSSLQSLLKKIKEKHA